MIIFKHREQQCEWTAYLNFSSIFSSTSKQTKATKQNIGVGTKTYRFHRVSRVAPAPPWPKKTQMVIDILKHPCNSFIRQYFLNINVHTFKPVYYTIIFFGINLHHCLSFLLCALATPIFKSCIVAKVSRQPKIKQTKIQLLEWTLPLVFVISEMLEVIN